MEDLIIYGTVVVIIIINFINNYQKELKKNKERALSKQQNIKPAPVNTQSGKFIENTKKNSDKINKTQSSRFQPSTASTYNMPDYGLFEEEGVSVFQNTMDEDSAISEEHLKEAKAEHKSLDLKLDTSEDLKKAFIYSLIFDRKY